ncbi:ATP synthase F0 subunit C [bacterium]|jgi:F-type H+-transporting ATPase subunit c|nr:ATP synthase F0 subunit C [bacterium]
MKKVEILILSVIAVLFAADPALAAEEGAAASKLGHIGAGVAIGLAALGGTLGQSNAVRAALDAIGRNPSASGQVFNPMIIGLALIESLVVLAFVIAFFLL